MNKLIFGIFFFIFPASFLYADTGGMDTKYRFPSSVYLEKNVVHVITPYEYIRTDYKS
jgi:hypothetical protein